jgi:hypothetical protein
MTRRQSKERRYAICIANDDSDVLTPRRVYEILRDASAEKSDYIRVVDDDGEDYLYPASRFVFVDFPKAVEKALRHVS